MAAVSSGAILVGMNGRAEGLDDSRPSAAASRFTVAVDLDMVCAEFTGMLREVMRASGRDRGAEMTDPDTWELYAQDSWPIADAASFRETLRFAVLEYRGMLHMEEIPGASESLWGLHEAGVHTHVAASRLLPLPGLRSLVVADTAAWLDRRPAPGRRPRIPYDDLSFVRDKASVRADLYVDDSPHQLRGLAAAGLPAVVFDQAYNRTAPGVRVRGWGDAVAEITAVHEAWKASAA